MLHFLKMFIFQKFVDSKVKIELHLLSQYQKTINRYIELNQFYVRLFMLITFNKYIFIGK